jgi:hypothetical protein
MSASQNHGFKPNRITKYRIKISYNIIITRNLKEKNDFERIRPILYKKRNS